MSTLVLPTSGTQSRRKSKTDIASSLVTYIGYADNGIGPSDDGWEIHRFYRQGNVTHKDIVVGIWDNRATLFSAIDLDTTLTLLYDGINDYANFGNVFNYDIANQFSVSLWVKPDNIVAAMCLFSKATNDALVDGYNLQFIASSGLLQLQMRSGLDRTHVSDLALTAATWQHVVFTYSGSSDISGARLYKNASVGATPSAGSLSGTMLFGQNFTLGSRNTAFPFSGNICHLTVWGKALSASEVSDLYNAGSPPDPQGLSFAGDLVTWCRCGDGDSSVVIYDSESTNHGTLVNFAANPYEADVP